MLSKVTVVNFSVQGVIFDLASFSFQVPICGSSAKHSAAPKKQRAKINPVVFVFMRLIELDFHFPSTFLFPRGRTIWIADAHRDDGKRFVVHADEKLTAFVEMESAICASRR
jgi:hypothetical protein